MIRRRIVLHGISKTPLIDSWIEKIPSAVEKQIDSDDGSAIMDIDVRLLAHHASGERYFVEATLSARRVSIHASTENENLPSAIEIVRDEIVNELSAGKKKREHFIRKGGRAFKDFIRGVYRWKNK